MYTQIFIHSSFTYLDTILMPCSGEKMEWGKNVLKNCGQCSREDVRVNKNEGVHFIL